MNHTRSKRLLLLSLVVLLLGVLLVVVVGCEYSAPFKIKNQTDLTLTIIISGESIGNAKAGEEIKNRNPRVLMTSRDYLIEAKNSQGDIVYSKSFSYDELVDMGWKIVIPKSN